jgi:hypothetical protein
VNFWLSLQMDPRKKSNTPLILNGGTSDGGQKLTQIKWQWTFTAIVMAGCTNINVTKGLNERQNPVAPARQRPTATPEANAPAPSASQGKTTPINPTDIKAPPPLTSVASIIGKLKSAPAYLIGNNSASLLSGAGVLSNNGGALISDRPGAWRLLALEEEPVVGARVRLVTPEGTPLNDEVASTDASGQFTLKNPGNLEGAMVQATFEAAGVPVEYLALADASETVELDTASTLLASRWRLERRRGLSTLPPGRGILARVRELLEPGRVPFMGLGSRDVADAFDQLLIDDEVLRRTTTEANSGLAQPGRPWRVEPWLSQEKLRNLGVLAQDGVLARGEASVFGIDADGRALMVVAGERPRLIRINQDERVETLSEVPADARGPFSLAFSPSKVLYLVHATPEEGLAVSRWDDDKFTRIFQTPPQAREIPDRAQGRLAVSNAGDVYLVSLRHHAIFVARPGANQLERYAGRMLQPGYQDGPRLDARFNAPRAIAMSPDGRLYVADRENNCIRRIETDGTVTTVAGKPGETISRFGRGTFSRIGEPGAIAVAADGTMFATDVSGSRALITRLSPDGSVFLVAGGPVRGKRDGLGPDARFIRPANLELDRAGNIYLEDIEESAPARYTFTLRKVVAPNTQ